MQGKLDCAPEGEGSPKAPEDRQHNLLLHKRALGLPARSQRYSTTACKHATAEPAWRPCPDLCFACLLMLRAVYSSSVLSACITFLLQRCAPAVGNDMPGMLLACLTQHSSDWQSCRAVHRFQFSLCLSCRRLGESIWQICM